MKEADWLVETIWLQTKKVDKKRGFIFNYDDIRNLAAAIREEIRKRLPKMGDYHATSTFEDGYIQGWDDYDERVRNALEVK